MNNVQYQVWQTTPTFMQLDVLNGPQKLSLHAKHFCERDLLWWMNAISHFIIFTTLKSNLLSQPIKSFGKMHCIFYQYSMQFCFWNIHTNLILIL